MNTGWTKKGWFATSLKGGKLLQITLDHPVTEYEHRVDKDDLRLLISRVRQKLRVS